LSQLFAVLANAFTGNIGQLRTGLQIQFPQITASFANRGHGVVEHCKREKERKREREKERREKKRERRRERCSKMVSPMLSPQNNTTIHLALTCAIVQIQGIHVTDVVTERFYFSTGAVGTP
jgi:hypothetical protein